MNSVTTSEIANNTITTTDIADATITNSDLAAGAVTSSEIADGTITTADVSSISASKISGITAGYNPKSTGSALTASQLRDNGNQCIIASSTYVGNAKLSVSASGYGMVSGITGFNELSNFDNVGVTGIATAAAECQFHLEVR